MIIIIRFASTESVSRFEGEQALSLKKTEQKQQNLLRLRQANPKIYQWDYRVQLDPLPREFSLIVAFGRKKVCSLM